MSPLARRLGLWTAAVGAALTLVVLYAPELVIPGPVTRGHAKLESDCFACHRPFLGPGAKLCADCHPLPKIAPARPAVAAFHGEAAARDCLACHSDHRGRAPALATPRFAHAVLGEAPAADCQGCHSRPTDALHARTTAGCAACHATDAWRPATLDHTAWFRFDRHHPADCAGCHTGSTFAAYTCYACHEHSPAKIRKEHLEEGIGDYEPCAVCHRSGDEDEAKRLWRDLRRRGLTPSEAARLRAAERGEGVLAPPIPGRAPPAPPELRREERREHEERDDHEEREEHRRRKRD